MPGTRDGAAEILNDSFLKIFDKLELYDFNRPFKAWIRRIFINTAIDSYRKAAPHWLQLDQIEAEAEELVIGIEIEQSQEQIIKLIQCLSPQYQVVFNLYVMEDFSHKEIAEKLGISEGTSRSNLLRAKKIIREKLSGNQSIIKSMLP